MGRGSQQSINRCQFNPLRMVLILWMLGGLQVFLPSDQMAVRPTVWIAMSNPGAGNPRFYNYCRRVKIIFPSHYWPILQHANRSDQVGVVLLSFPFTSVDPGSNPTWIKAIMWIRFSVSRMFRGLCPLDQRETQTCYPFFQDFFLLLSNHASGSSSDMFPAKRGCILMYILCAICPLGDR